MKRRIEVTANGVRIVATIDTKHRLSRDEVEKSRDDLADKLMQAASAFRYFYTPLSRVQVK